jgi:hypothetical protein
MALGDVKIATAHVQRMIDGTYGPSRTYTYALFSTAFSAIDANVVDNVPDIGAGLIAAAGAYTPLTTVTGAAVSVVGNQVRFDCDDIAIAANAANPTTARTLVIFMTSAANGSQPISQSDIVAIIDLTSNGSTPITLTNGANIAINASGLYQATVNA